MEAYQGLLNYAYKVHSKGCHVLHKKSQCEAYEINYSVKITEIELRTGWKAVSTACVKNNNILLPAVPSIMCHINFM
jgi:hypothetical protein